MFWRLGVKDSSILISRITRGPLQLQGPFRLWKILRTPSLVDIFEGVPCCPKLLSQSGTGKTGVPRGARVGERSLPSS
jgi:hypothetical protein